MATQWIGDEISSFNVGDVGFLIRKYHATKGWEKFELRDHPGKTNMSLEIKLDGWLGSTNDISATALGVWKVVRVAKNGRAQVARLEGNDEAAALEELGYPDI